jgi:adenylate cyclase
VRSNVQEIHRLAAATEEMKTGLRSFQKYVPAELVRSLLSSGLEARLGGERRVVTICFSDIADFTPIAESVAPETLVELLGEHLSILSEQIHNSGGTIDKYMGDAVMAFWNAPLPNPTHALAACQAAVRGRDRLHELQLRAKNAGNPVFSARFGIHTGEALVGNMGSETRLNYTVIGNNVNLASRLEGLNKHFGTEIMISDATFQDVSESVVARPLNWVAVQGKTEATLVYELLGLKGEVDAAAEQLVELSAAALAAYRKQNWAEAIEWCERTLRLRAGDRPSQILIARCRAYCEKPPGEKWDKIHRMQSK